MLVHMYPNNSFQHANSSVNEFIDVHTIYALQAQLEQWETRPISAEMLHEENVCFSTLEANTALLDEKNKKYLPFNKEKFSNQPNSNWLSEVQ